MLEYGRLSVIGLSHVTIVTKAVTTMPSNRAAAVVLTYQALPCHRTEFSATAMTATRMPITLAVIKD